VEEARQEMTLEGRMEQILTFVSRPNHGFFADEKVEKHKDQAQSIIEIKGKKYRLILEEA
jgi:hypothetical protein